LLNLTRTLPTKVQGCKLDFVMKGVGVSIFDGDSVTNSALVSFLSFISVPTGRVA